MSELIDSGLEAWGQTSAMNLENQVHAFLQSLKALSKGEWLVSSAKDELGTAGLSVGESIQRSQKQGHGRKIGRIGHVIQTA